MQADPNVSLLLVAKDRDLLAELGAALLGEGTGFGVQDPARARRFAERWLDQRKHRIREALCRDEAVRAALRGRAGDRMTDLAVIADALAALVGKPALTVLSVILLRRGLEAICGPLEPE